MNKQTWFGIVKFQDEPFFTEKLSGKPVAHFVAVDQRSYLKKSSDSKRLETETETTEIPMQAFSTNAVKIKERASEGTPLRDELCWIEGRLSNDTHGKLVVTIRGIIFLPFGVYTGLRTDPMPLAEAKKKDTEDIESTDTAHGP